MPVYIANCVCPQGHEIISAMAEAKNDREAKKTHLTKVRQEIQGMVAVGTVNRYCPHCGAPATSWSYEVRPTTFKTIAEAKQHLADHPQSDEHVADTVTDGINTLLAVANRMTGNERSGGASLLLMAAATLWEKGEEEFLREAKMLIGSLGGKAERIKPN